MAKTKRFETGILPEGSGDFETGCHTSTGNDLCLYVQTTRDLYFRMERVFQQVLQAKKRWSGLSLFNPSFMIEKDAQSIYTDAVAMYAKDIGIHFKGEPGTYEDFYRWMLRGFDDFVIENEIQARGVVA